MKIKNGLDLSGFQLTNFCIQGEASAPSDAALGRKYFHTNATDDVATGISLLHRERIYLGEGVWRATAYLDDIAAINEKLNLITGDSDTDTLINNLKDLEEFLKDFSETDKLKSLLDAKLNTSGGTITSSNYDGLIIKRASDSAGALIAFENNGGRLGLFGFEGAKKVPIVYLGADTSSYKTLIHSGNYSSYALPLSGGTIDGSSSSVTTPLTINTTYYYEVSVIDFNHKGVNRGGVGLYANGAWLVYGDGERIGIRNDGKPVYALGYNQNGYELIHSGNIGSQKVAGLATPRTIWGQSFDGTGNIESTSDLKVNVIRDANSNITLGSDGSGNITIGTRAVDHAIDFMVSKGVTMRVANSGNILIGTTTDNGAKLQVDGSSHFLSYIGASTEIQLGSRIPKSTMIGADKFGLQVWGQGDGITRMQVGRIDGQATAYDLYLQPLGGNVRIFGNLIVDGEISAGEAGAEEGTSGSGSAEGVSEIFTPTSTSMAFDHNLGEDVIVQVYEKSGNVWNMVIVDTEITSATRVTLRFGKTETTQHKVVIMGV